MATWPSEGSCVLSRALSSQGRLQHGSGLRGSGARATDPRSRGGRPPRREAGAARPGRAAGR
eukprot:4589342-Pyramimonas_sp.AAC.1